MLRIHENIRELDNGNIMVRFSPDDVSAVKSGKLSSMEALMYVLDELDCYTAGDEFCLGNYTMGVTVYNAYSDLCYTLDLSDIDNVLMRGDFLELYARIPDTYDREILKEKGYCDDYKRK